MGNTRRSIRTLFHNLSFLSRHDVRGLLREEYKQLQIQSSFASLVANSYRIEYGEEKDSALDYVKETGRYDMIPYPMIRDSQPFFSGVDETLKLPYVIHGDRKLFFPASWSVERMSSMYRHFIENEQLTGERFRKHAPHCYIAHNFKVEPKDVLLDVGCAEGLLSLSCLWGISYAYLIENDPEWFVPIEATFNKELGEKVTLVRKSIGCFDSKDTIRLQTIIEKDPRDSFFVKMDIEGSEVEILHSSMDFLRDTKKKIKLAVCCYHRPNDSTVIEELVSSIGYSYEFSDGYILASFDDPFESYSLRRGVIRAKNF